MVELINSQYGIGIILVLDWNLMVFHLKFAQTVVDLSGGLLCFGMGWNNSSCS